MMRLFKLFLGMGLVIVSAWAARLATAVYSAYDRFHPREGSAAIVRRTVFLFHHALKGWQIPATIILLWICSAALFIAGCWLAFSILREPEEGGKGRRGEGGWFLTQRRGGAKKK